MNNKNEIIEKLKRIEENLKQNNIQDISSQLKVINKEINIKNKHLKNLINKSFEI